MRIKNNWEGIDLVCKLTILMSILCLLLGKTNIYLDVLMGLFVVNQSRYIHHKNTRKVIQFIFLTIMFFSIHYFDIFSLLLSFLVLFMYSNFAFIYFDKNKSLSLKNSPATVFSKFVSLRFKWNYNNLRKDWVNSSNLVLNIIIIQLYFCNTRLDFTIFLVLSIFFIVLFLYKINNLLSIVFLNTSRRLCKRIIRLSKFVSLQDAWVISRGTLISMLVLYISNKLTFINIVSVVIIGIVTYILLKLITIIVLMMKSEARERIWNE